MVLSVRARAAAAMIATALAAGAGCASAPASVPPVTVNDAEGRPRDLRAVIAGSPFTVVTFFSAHCPCQRAHDERLRALYAAYAPRGVAFVAIDAEQSATPEHDAIEARARAYPFPLWTDARGASADALGADAATYTVIVDRAGVVRYAGGIDSDHTDLNDDATAFVRDALDDLLAGRAPRRTRGKVLGCALQR